MLVYWNTENDYPIVLIGDEGQVLADLTPASARHLIDDLDVAVTAIEQCDGSRGGEASSPVAPRQPGCCRTRDLESEVAATLDSAGVVGVMPLSPVGDVGFAGFGTDGQSVGGTPPDMQDELQTVAKFPTAPLSELIAGIGAMPGDPSKIHFAGMEFNIGEFGMLHREMGNFLSRQRVAAFVPKQRVTEFVSLG